MFDVHHTRIGSAKASISPSACNAHTWLFLIEYCLLYYIICLCLHMAKIRAFDSIFARHDEIITQYIVCPEAALVQCSFQHSGSRPPKHQRARV